MMTGLLRIPLNENIVMIFAYLLLVVCQVFMGYNPVTFTRCFILFKFTDSSLSEMQVFEYQLIKPRLYF